jgi:hypothetical protein
MGTITSRKKKDGTLSLTAQIRVNRNGQTVYQESQTFGRRPAAAAWIKKREYELAEPGALEKASKVSVSVHDAIYKYLDEYGKLRPLGDTKRNTLKAIAASWLGDLLLADLNSQRLVEYAHWRIGVDGGAVQPQTVGNDWRCYVGGAACVGV